MTHDEGVVLIVEDDADDRELLARAFKKANIEVPLSFATDGDEALAYLNNVEGNPSQAKPFIILLDLNHILESALAA